MWEIYLSIMFFCLVTSITPGPNNIMLMTSGINHGVKKTLPHFFGIIVGFPTMLAAIGLGLGAVFIYYPVTHQVIKVLGATYFLFLAWKIGNSTNSSASDKLKAPLTFIQALAFQWINPKAWIIAVGAIATFTTMGNFKIQVLAIILCFATVGSVCMAIWMLMGVGLQRLISNQQQLQYFNIFMAVLLVGSLVSMVIMDISNA
jgi:threonine/homoserine/homoserine lactone efflux protein